MTIVGDRWNAEYANKLEAEITKLGINDKVRILPMQDKDSLIELYHQSDICFFPSYQQAGFSRIPLEAMACGCLVISYGNEGSLEIIRDDDNGYLLEEGNLTQVIELIQRLENNQAEKERIIKNSRHEMEQQHSITDYIDQIESYLKWTLNQS